MRKINLTFLLLTVLLRVQVYAQTKGEVAPYQVKFSEEKMMKGDERAYSQKTIGTNEKSLYILFTESNKSGYYGRKDLIVKKYNKESLEFENEVRLKDILKEMDSQEIFDIQIFDEGLIVLFGSGNRADYEVGGLIYNKELDLISTNQHMLNTSRKDFIFDVKVNTARREILIVEYPETDIEENRKGRYLRFDANLVKLDEQSLDLSFLLTEKRRLSKSNIRGFLNKAQFTSNNRLINVTKASYVGSSQFIGLNLNDYMLYMLNLDNNKAFTRNIELNNGMTISGISMFLNENSVSLTGFYIEDTKEQGVIFTKTISQIKGTFLYTFDSENGSLINEKIVPFEQVYLDKIISNHAIQGKEKKAKKKLDKMEDDEGIGANYEVVDVYYSDDSKEAYFVCEYIYNYEVTTTYTDSKGNTRTTTTYYALRGSSFVFSLSLETGNILWMNNLKKYSLYKSSSYSIWNKTTLVPYKEGNKIRLLYATATVYNDGAITGNYRSESKLEFPFYTCTIDLSNGTSEVFEPALTDEVKSPLARVNMDELTITQEGNIYTINSIYKRRPVRTVLVTLGYLSIVGMPVSYIYHVASIGKARNEVMTIAKVNF